MLWIGVGKLKVADDRPDLPVHELADGVDDRAFLEIHDSSLTGGRESSGGRGTGACRAWDRLYTNKVRWKVQTTVPSWLNPSVAPVTTPTFSRDFDSRSASTFERE